MSEVQQFYTGRNIFITGVTGFVGKILTEKLLRSCEGVKTIYVLIRMKKGKSMQERIDALLQDSVFDVLRNDFPDFAKKVVGLAGDITQDRLGLSATDYARIANEVSVIFHLAATVRFNETLETAVSTNVNSVKLMVDIAKACKNLQVAVYVSTAYSHCPRNSIKEELYPAPLSYEEINKLVNDARKKNWSKNEMKNFEEKVLGKWPNTYSFTKAIAEGVIAEFAKDIPIAVFRPSIVISAYAEPVPGWISGPTGLPGLITVSGLGVMHTGLVDNDARADVVPVDCVCNALISCAWETGITERRLQNDIPVYNYISGNENPITWRRIFDTAFSFGHIYPSTKAIYYPSVINTKFRWLYVTLEFFLHLIPAFIIENGTKLFGKKVGITKLVRIIADAERVLEYFTTRQWDFENQRIQNLWKKIALTDKRTFPFSMKNVNWDEHIMRMVRGCWKYITGEADWNEEKARKRHFYLFIIHIIVQLAFGIFILWITWKMFCGRSLSIA